MYEAGARGWKAERWNRDKNQFKQTSDFEWGSSSLDVLASEQQVDLSLTVLVKKLDSSIVDGTDGYRLAFGLPSLHTIADAALHLSLVACCTSFRYELLLPCTVYQLH